VSLPRINSMLYQNKYRIETARYKNWNYSNEGLYFVTICVKKHLLLLGAVHDEKVILSETGKCVEECWKEIPNHFPFVRLDEYIIMPNHIHGIIEITHSITETQNLVSLRNIPNRNPGKFGSQTRNLPSIIRGFKIGVKNCANFKGISFEWQRGYYDHIVSRDKELNNIRNYIKSNPTNWDLDRYNIDSVETQDFVSPECKIASN